MRLRDKWKEALTSSTGSKFLIRFPNSDKINFRVLPDQSTKVSDTIVVYIVIAMNVFSLESGLEAVF